MSYYLDHVVANIAGVENTSEGEDTKLELLKQLAEMSQWCPDLDKLNDRLKNLYTAIKVTHDVNYYEDDEVVYAQKIYCQCEGYLWLSCYGCLIASATNTSRTGSRST